MGKPKKRGAAPAPPEEPIPASSPISEEHADGGEEGAEDQEAEDEDLPSITFNDALTWKAGRPIVVAELIRRLAALHSELSGIEQGNISRASLVPIAQDLAHHQLLHHKDRGVEAWVAVCLTDVFRLLAPEAPYKSAQLKEIFTLFIDNIIPALGKSRDAYHDLHLYVLKTLNELQLLSLLSDLSGAESLVIRLYVKCFDLCAVAPNTDAEDAPSQSLSYALTETLSIMTSQYDNLPRGVTDVILAQFLRADPATYALYSQSAVTKERMSDENMPEVLRSYTIAQGVCNMASEVMIRAISQYFNTVVLDASDTLGAVSRSNGKRRRGSEDADAAPDQSAQTLTSDQNDELQKAHRLLRELWRACPSVVQSVVLQIQAELSVDNIAIRQIATETIGDMISGLGAAGVPEAVVLDPAAYPSIAITPSSSINVNGSTPSKALQSFHSVYPTVYADFMNRKNDKAPQVRAAYAICIGRILNTTAGGLGLDHDEQCTLLDALAEMLLDSDDRVRLSAIRAIAGCAFDKLVIIIGSHGDVNKEGSILYNLADRIRDRKHNVRSEAMRLLGQIWGVSSGAMAKGNDVQQTLFGPIASKILEAAYVNDKDLTGLMQETLYTSLLPVSFPPIKTKKASNSQDSQTSRNGSKHADVTLDPDAIRTERLLLLVQSLSEKAKTVFFALQTRQVTNAKYLDAFTKHCEVYNGGVANGADKDAKGAKTVITKIITFFAQTQSDALTASDQLWKIAKKNDRRLYHLLRCVTSPDKDYNFVHKAIKELVKRLREQPNGNDILSTLLSIVHSCSILLYNKSHVPTIMEYARTDDQDLGSTAHEVLKEILNNHPEVLKAHVKSISEAVVENIPEPGDYCDVGTIKTLKACASFAQKDPAAMPHDRAFLQSMVKFALHGRPPQAAKHAVSVIVYLQKNKDMYIQNIVKKCTDGFEYGSRDYLAQLAALAQLSLLAADDIEQFDDTIMAIAIKDVLLSQSPSGSDSNETWDENIDDDCMARILALKILVNRLRFCASARSSADLQENIQDTASQVYRTLMRYIESDGEIIEGGAGPPAHRSRLRLTAAVLLLKLSCASKHFDHFFGPKEFQRLAAVMQDSVEEVRAGFNRAVRKYLGPSALPSRFYAILFLMAFEPSKSLKEATTTWLRTRAAALAKANDTVLELTFARLISLLAHHVDFEMAANELNDSGRYIIYYLQTVATKTNLPLIFHVAQKIKSVQDGIDRDMDERLYCLSELSQAIIREYAEHQNWELPAFTGKLGMPAGIFEQLPSHARAQEIADKQFAPQEVLDNVEDLVRTGLRNSKKRKPASANAAAPRKRVRSGAGAPKRASGAAKTPKIRRASSLTSAGDAGEIRRSARRSNAQSYAGMDDSDDDDEGEEVQGAVAVSSSVAAQKSKASRISNPDDDKENLDDAQESADEDDAEEGDDSSVTSNHKPTDRNIAFPTSTKAVKTKTKPARPAARHVSKKAAPTRNKKTSNEVQVSDDELSDVPDDLDGELDAEGR